MDNTIDEKERQHEIAKSSFETIDDETVSLLSNTRHGFSWKIAALFITGEVLGGGAVAMADGMVNSGYFGILVVIVGFFINIFASEKLSQAVLIATHSDKASVRHRNPYTYTISKALGGRSQLVVGILLNVTSTCVTTVYLLISTELFSLVINDIFPDFESKYEFRIFLTVIAVVLIPVMLLGSPKDFWGVALFATLTTVFAVTIATALLWIDASISVREVHQREISPYSFFNGFGTLLFAFAGVPFLPNIQMDLNEPRDFSKSIYLGFAGILITYIPLIVVGYAVLGDDVNANIIYNVFNIHMIAHNVGHYKLIKVLSYVTLVLFGGHFTCAYNLIFNSTAQEMENYMKAPRGFCWQRVVVRVGLILLTFMLAQLIPNFDIILSFAGGVLLSILSFHLPIAAYIKLRDNIPLHEKVLLFLILFIATAGVLGTLYTSALSVIRIYKKI